ncbi:MAG TPA: hypothetical protein PK657_03300 [Legionella sp.]|nr:hypothetical protein [Legionella sp.]
MHPNSFINNIDSDARANIIKLDQKLRGLKAEIEAKLKNLSWNPEDLTNNYTEKLSLVAEEIDKALEGIGILVTLAHSESTKEVYDSSEIKEFTHQLSEQVNQINQLKDQF